MSDDPAFAFSSPAVVSALPAETDFRPDSWRGGPGRHRLGRTQDGQWWWVDPVAGPQVLAGIHGVTQAVGTAPVLSALDQVGFNLLVPPVAEAFCRNGAAHLGELKLRQAGDRIIRLAGVQLPDVFDPRWAEAVTTRVRAAVSAPGLAGWLTDDELRWGAATAQSDVPLARPGLLQVFLSLDPDYSAYHSAWEFVFATRGGGLAQLSRDWNVSLPNKESLRQLTREDGVIDSPAYRADLERFQREVAQRYHRTTITAVREADPGRLVFAAPIGPGTPAAVREAAATHGDAVLVTARGSGGGNAPEVWWQANPWADFDPTAAGRDEPPGVTAVERALRRIRETWTAAHRDPQCVGVTWGPHGGGDLAVDDPLACGLFDANGRRNPVWAPALAALHATAAAVRARGIGGRT